MHNIYTVKRMGDVTSSGKEAISFKKPKFYIVGFFCFVFFYKCANQHNCI